MTSPESELVSAGFFLVRMVQRPPGLGDNLLPPRLLTLTECLTDIFPSTWALAWSSESNERRLAAASKFGIHRDALPDVIASIMDAFDAGDLAWPDVWTSLTAAQTAARRFHLDQRDLVLVELAIPRDAAARLLAQLEPGPNEGPPGVYTCLQRQSPPTTSGVVAGWEPLGVELGGSFHSWLCNNLPQDVQRQLGIVPNELGLLTHEHDARAVDDLLQSGIGAEPVPWFPAQLVVHPS